MATVFDIARNATAVIGLQDLTSLVGNTGQHARAMLVLLNRAGRNLSQMRNTWGGSWSVLTREYVFTTVAGQDEYAFPEDFQAIVDGSVWNRSTFREARGPLSPQEWQQLKSGLVETTAIAPFYRLRRGSSGRQRSFLVDPVPGDAETLVIEYMSRNWVISGDGTTFRDGIAADTDDVLYDDDLLEMDLIWRFKQSRGLSFAAELAEYEIERDRRFAEDSGTRTLTLGTPAFEGYDQFNIPETIPIP